MNIWRSTSNGTSLGVNPSRHYRTADIVKMQVNFKIVVIIQQKNISIYVFSWIIATKKIHMKKSKRAVASSVVFNIRLWF